MSCFIEVVVQAGFCAMVDSFLLKMLAGSDYIAKPRLILPLNIPIEAAKASNESFNNLKPYRPVYTKCIPPIIPQLLQCLDILPMQLVNIRLIGIPPLLRHRNRLPNNNIHRPPIRTEDVEPTSRKRHLVANSPLPYPGHNPQHSRRGHIHTIKELILPEGNNRNEIRPRLNRHPHKALADADDHTHRPRPRNVILATSANGDGNRPAHTLPIMSCAGQVSDTRRVGHAAHPRREKVLPIYSW